MKVLPKFSVGEVVILHSVSRPELNCEDTILEVIEPNNTSIDRIYGGVVRHKFARGYGYKLENTKISGVTEEGLSCEKVWAESALRKKQEPGEMSFMQLMSSLKIEEKV